MGKILYAILLCSFYGCMTQNFVPPRPLQKGENELRISFNYSMNKFDWHSIQFSAFHGITDNDVIGTSLNNFIIPNHISYAHFWEHKNSSQNIQFHLNDLLASNFNPSLELDVGFSHYSGDIYNTFKLGIGYYGTPLLFWATRNNVIQHKIAPIFGYRFQTGEFSADVQLIHGMTSYFIRYYKDDFRRHSRKSVDENHGLSSGYTFAYDEIDTILIKDDRYGIITHSSDTLVISKYSPFGDCIKCGLAKDFHSAYPASENHKVYWVYWKNHWLSGERPQMLELDMSRLLENFADGKPLELIEDDNLSEKTLLKHNLFFQDLFFSVGRVEYQK